MVTFFRIISVISSIIAIRHASNPGVSKGQPTGVHRAISLIIREEDKMYSTKETGG